MFVNCSQNGQLRLYQNQCTFQKIHSLSMGGAHSRLLVHIASPTSPPLCRYTTHSSFPHTATVEMPFLWHCSTNGKLRILVKAQPAPQAPGHCHQLGLAYGRETWLYPTNTLSAFLLLPDTNFIPQAGITHYSQLLTRQHSTKLLQWRIQSAAVARAQHGHNTLRVASCLGPAQLPAAYSTEMEKQLGGSGGCFPRKFLSFLGRFWGYFRPYRCLELEHFGNAFATNLRAQRKITVVLTANTYTSRSGGEWSCPLCSSPQVGSSKGTETCGRVMIGSPKDQHFFEHIFQMKHL